jgi:dUTP pyrophosphatase
LVEIKIVNTSPFALPAYQTIGSAGMDLCAILELPITLQPLERAFIATGISIELPLGFEAQVRPRSGLALKRGLTCLNSPGTIDSDYRGELRVILVNLSNTPQTIEHGERIAQIVISRVEQAVWLEVMVLNESQRGAGGFGSTGVN